MRLLALDLGSKRIGTAVSDDLELTAQPLSVLNRHGGARDLQAIGRLVREQQAGEVVIGLPLNMDGSEGAAAAQARRFAERLGAALGIPVRLWDERLTTWEAEGVLKEARVKPIKRRAVVDKLAAALILRSYLDARRTGDSDQTLPKTSEQRDDVAAQAGPASEGGPAPPERGGVRGGESGNEPPPSGKDAR